MKSAKSKRQLTLLTLVAALGVAVYLNWEYAKNDSPYAMQEAAAVNATVETEEEQPVLEALPDKNYGDAQLVSAGAESTDSYFEQARLSRTKTRDEALDKMQSTLKNTQLTDAEKKTITENLTAVIEGITLESFCRLCGIFGGQQRQHCRENRQRGLVKSRSSANPRHCHQ